MFAIVEIPTLLIDFWDEIVLICWNFNNDSSSVILGRGKLLSTSFLITDGRLLNIATLVPRTAASETL